MPSISKATAYNWNRLDSDTAGKLTTRANKTLSARRVVAANYLKDGKASSLLEALTSNISPVKDVIYTLCVDYLKAKGLWERGHVQKFFSRQAAYLKRNRFLYLFELAPRTFGETWGQRHLMELVPELSIPNRQEDPDYEGQYDLLLDGIRVEVKASRAVMKKGGDTLAEKALASNSKKKFDMNYQQLKPGCCDVFVWIAVWRDKIDYWVMSSKTVQENPLLSNQHRASQMTEAGDVVEGQIHINNGNYETFEPYRVKSRDIYAMIKRCKQES